MKVLVVVLMLGLGACASPGPGPSPAPQELLLRHQLATACGSMVTVFLVLAPQRIYFSALTQAGIGRIVHDARSWCRYDLPADQLPQAMKQLEGALLALEAVMLTGMPLP